LRDHRTDGELALLEQVRLIASKIIRSELVGRLSEVLGECRNRTHMAAGCTIGVITTLEFSPASSCVNRSLGTLVVTCYCIVL
jgi:hypothetical protein